MKKLKNSKFAHVCTVVATCLALSLCAFAQSDNGVINGTVKDPSGAGIPNATVVVKNQGNGVERTFTTNNSGVYAATNLPPAFYTISISVAGFKKFETTNAKLDPASTLEVNADLTIGAPTETVEVSSSAQQLQTESASVQKLVTRDQIDSLELNGRNPVGLASLVPGAHGGNLAGLSFNFNQGPSNFNGSRNPDNLITYDGAPATRTRSNGTSLGAADVDSTSEVQILTASYAAEYGRTAGAQIRIVTKAGGSEFHGAAYEYVRNAVFNANTWTRNKTNGQNFVPTFNYNQYGFNIGGPFYIPGKLNTAKNKFFWYWGDEWVRYRFTDSAQWTVPSALMRQGNFSELLTVGPANILGKVVQLKDPTTGNPISGNIIPAGQLSPNGLGILKAYPAPNLAIGNFIGLNNYYITALHPQDQRKDTLAADINVTDRDRISFRRNNYQFNEYQPLDGTPTETPKYFHRPNQTNSLNYVKTISPNLVNEAQATVSLDDVYIPVDTAHFFNRTTAGINYPYIFPTGKLIQNRIPTANITGLNTLTGNPYPSHSAGPIYTATDSLTWIKGTHTLKFGFYWELSGENDNDEINVSACPTCTNNQNGQFLFSDTRSGFASTGNAIGNTAFGLFDSYSELGQRAYTPFRGSSYEPYVQDSWKVNDKLTLNFGARYTVIVPYHAIWGNMIVFDPALYNPAKAVTVTPTGQVVVGAGDRYNGMVIPGSAFSSAGTGRFPEASEPSLQYLFRGGTYPNYFSKIHWDQIQPRVGLAYQLDPKTVIRAGGGRFFTRLGVSDSIFLGGNPPFQPTANVSFGSADNPGGTAGNVLPLTVTTQSRNFKNPEAWNWNFTVERQILGSLLSVGYVGRRGLHEQRESDINQPLPSVVAAAKAINPTVNIDSLRPYLGYNSIRETDNVASSMYNSLQLSWNKRMSHGILFGFAYTLSKSMDNGSNQRDIIPNTYYAGNLWGPSEFDARHVFIANFQYEIPFFSHATNLAGKLLGGWQISGIIQAQTGTPCSVGKSNDYAGVGVDGSLCGVGNYWVMNGTINYPDNFDAANGAQGNYWFTTKNTNGTPIFTQPVAGTFNNQPGIRDIIYNPGFTNFNAGLFKKFVINERWGFQFRAEAFDVLNHPNLNGANMTPDSSQFGQITSKTNDVRQMQLSLRLYF